MRRGVYPGSFNPPTMAHLEIAAAAADTHDLDELVFTVSRLALAKEHVAQPSALARAEVLRASVAHLRWARVEVTDAQLIADIAEGFDVVVMGADKWHQVNDLAFYGGSVERRDAALARLPRLAVAARPPATVPPEHLLDVPDRLADVSSTRARQGDHLLMTEAARASGLWAQ